MVELQKLCPYPGLFFPDRLGHFIGVDRILARVSNVLLKQFPK